MYGYYTSICAWTSQFEISIVFCFCFLHFFFYLVCFIFLICAIVILIGFETMYQLNISHIPSSDPKTSLLSESCWSYNLFFCCYIVEFGTLASFHKSYQLKCYIRHILWRKCSTIKKKMLNRHMLRTAKQDKVTQ